MVHDLRGVGEEVVRDGEVDEGEGADEGGGVDEGHGCRGWCGRVVGARGWWVRVVREGRFGGRCGGRCGERCGRVVGARGWWVDEMWKRERERKSCG